MAYKIDNAIVKKDIAGNLTLIDPENVFEDEDSRAVAVTITVLWSPTLETPPTIPPGTPLDSQLLRLKL